MDSSPEFSSTPQVSEMVEEKENSPSESGGSQPASSETLVKDLRNLSLDPATELPAQPVYWDEFESSSESEDDSPPPRDLRARDRGNSTRSEKALWEIRGGYPYRRRGVRTVLSERRERMSRMRLLLSLMRPRKVKEERNVIDFSDGESESTSVPFKCTCNFCEQNGWDPSENAKIGSEFTTSF